MSFVDSMFDRQRKSRWIFPLKNPDDLLLDYLYGKGEFSPWTYIYFEKYIKEIKDRKDCLKIT